MISEPGYLHFHSWRYQYAPLLIIPEGGNFLLGTRQAGQFAFAGLHTPGELLQRLHEIRPVPVAPQAARPSLDDLDI